MSSDLVQTFDNFLPKTLLDRCFSLCNEADYYATIGAQNRTDCSIRNTLLHRGDNLLSNHSESLDNITKHFWDVTERYFSKLHMCEGFNTEFVQQHYKLEILNFLKYKPGGFYKDHTDECFIGTAILDFIRQLSYVLFVNDDFSGGGLYFSNTREKVKVKANRLVMFPSSWAFPHQVLPVLRGVRYSVVTWGGYVL